MKKIKHNYWLISIKFKYFISYNYFYHFVQIMKQWIDWVYEGDIFLRRN